MNRNYFALSCAVLAVVGLLSYSCNDDDDVFERVYWKLYLTPQSQVPAVDRTETAKVIMQLLSDNRFSYSITVSGLDAADSLTTAHMRAGDPLTNGPVVLDLAPKFVNQVARGSMVLRQSLVDSLLDLGTQLYVSVQSANEPGGLLRGQVQTDVIMAADVELSGDEVVPAVTTTALGKALIRVTSDNMLFSHVSVVNLETADAMASALIRLGAAGVNGDSLLSLADSAANFGQNRAMQLTAAELSTLKSQATNIVARSRNHPAGLLRGQLK